MADVQRLELFVPPDRAAQLEEREQLDRAARQKVRRRLALRWLGWGAVLALLGQWSTGFLGFFWPSKVGAFGGTVPAGTVSDYQVGDVKLIREGKFYVTRVPEGFLALWWKCPHLGCTVPWKQNDPVMGGPPGPGDAAFADTGRFNCPCHGSIYNRYGQILQGPAPRPLDLFPLRIDHGKLLVETGPTKAITRAAAELSDVVLPT